ncbi:hypothetical protein DXT94_23250 [Rhizobium sp. ICMP 5592]|nr:hypothetical protein [Rhizobium sp. ICMP 5592]
MPAAGQGYETQPPCDPQKSARHATLGRWYDISNIVNKIIDAMTIMWGFGQGGAWTLVLVEK